VTDLVISDLLTQANTRATSLSAPPINALTEPDGLREAQIIAVHFDAVHSQAAVLFELRTSLQFDASNTGVLIASRVRELTWMAPARGTTRTAWTVGGTEAAVDEHEFRMGIGLWPGPGARLTLVAEHAVFVSGDVSGLPETPPNYVTASSADLLDQIAGWNSSFLPHHAVSSHPGVRPRSA
jgi:hypothetical protein